jgi:hypothetical protein
MPAAVLAQQDIRANEWSHGTTMNGFAGVAADSSRGAPVLGGAVGWELTPTLAIEGSGAWLDCRHGANAFSGAVKTRVRLSGRRTVDPFVHAGVGLYRATFAGSATSVPDFYRRRMTGTLPPGVIQTFTDPTLVAGGGVSMFVNRHLALRPDVEATLVFREGRSYVVTTVALHAVYHFESHPVTPIRRAAGKR